MIKLLQDILTIVLLISIFFIIFIYILLEDVIIKIKQKLKVKK